MKIYLHYCDQLKRIYFLILMICFFFLHPIFSQPPAQGPPLTDDKYTEYDMFVVLNFLEFTIQKNIDSTNAHIQKIKDSTNVDAHLSYTYKAYQPQMTTTTIPDAPNQNIVHVPLIVTYTVDNISWHGVPYFSRTITQSFDIYVACKNWFTTQGALNFTTVLGAPYLEGNSFGEGALDFFIGNSLTNYVNNKMRASFPPQTQYSTGGGIIPLVCNCLGLNPGTNEANNYKDAVIKYEYKKPIFNGGGGTNIYNTIDVNLLSIKRLSARSQPGNQILYQPQEDLQLSFYVNQTLKVAQISQISEGDVRNLNLGNIQLTKPADNGSVILIAKIEQQPQLSVKDSQFEVFYKSNNFGNGTQKLVVQKTYWLPPQHLPGGGTTKPTKVSIDAYELTVSINVHTPVVNGANTRN